MSDNIKLSLTAGEAKTLVFSLIEYRRLLGLASMSDEDKAAEEDLVAIGLLAKIDAAAQEALRATATEESPETRAVEGARKLVNYAHSIVAQVVLIAREHGLCPSCALDATTRMLRLSADANAHDKGAFSLDAEEKFSGEEFLHKPGNA